MTARQKPTKPGKTPAHAPRQRVRRVRLVSVRSHRRVRPSKPGKGTAPAPPRRRRRSAAGLLAWHGDWVTGYNDVAPTCVPTAIANSLLAVTGQRVTDDDVLLLFRQSGGVHDVTVADSLRALAVHGIGGHRPVACLPWGGPLASGDIAGVGGVHAAAMTDAGLISWGAPLPGGWEPDGEVWRVRWSPR